MEEIIESEEVLEAEAEGSEEEYAEVDYRELIDADIKALKASFPELSELSDISELEDPMRYGALRDLGLTPEEAYRATTTRARVQKNDNRAHLRSSAPRAASSPTSNMSYREMEIAKSIFSDISDAEIQRLYRKVTK